jgi:hypothetical protein
MMLAFLLAHWYMAPALAGCVALLVYLHALLPAAALCLLTPFALQLLIAAAAFAQSVKPSREGELEEQIRAHKHALLGLFRPRDHVDMSKLERALLKLEKELAQLQGKQEVYRDGKKLPAKRPPPDVAGLLTYGVQPLALLTLAALQWGAPPVLHVAPELLWPVGWMYLGRAGLGTSAWLWLCATTASRAVPAAAAALGLAPVREKGFLDSVGLGMLQPVANMFKLS